MALPAAARRGERGDAMNRAAELPIQAESPSLDRLRAFASWTCESTGLDRQVSETVDWIVLRQQLYLTRKPLAYVFDGRTRP